MTNDEGQMRNTWRKLKRSRRWAISLASVVVGLLLAYALSRKPAVTLEIVELKQELLRPYGEYSDQITRSEALESHWVAELELRNNSSAEIQYRSFFTDGRNPYYDLLCWTNGAWVSDRGFAAQESAGADQRKRGKSSRLTTWSNTSLQPGGSLRFRVDFKKTGHPSSVALEFLTPRQKVKFYDLLPRALVDRLPWRKEWHQVESHVILNGAKELPPWWRSKPDISKIVYLQKIGSVGVGR